ncbi:MAG: hypothetical protein H7Y11_06575, partial [Armatimonadetes bacterium]|nr:hypothetical protein [Anaerolineae bacterium]
TNATKDKRKCNKAGKPPVAHSEACAFQFTGTAGVKTTLTQLVPIDGITPGATLVLSGWAYAKNVAVGGKLQVKLKYTDTTKAKVKLEVAPGSYEYVKLQQVATVTGALDSVKVTLSMQADGGKFYVDDISLTLTSSVRRDGLIALPGVPGLSRQG